MSSLSIRSKLFLAIFFACAVVVTAAASLFHYRIQQAFNNYIHTLDTIIVDNSAAALEDYYATHENWAGMQERFTWRTLVRSSNRQIRRQLPFSIGAIWRRNRSNEFKHL